jgi:hypothetical protein
MNAFAETPTECCIVSPALQIKKISRTERLQVREQRLQGPERLQGPGLDFRRFRF